MSIRVAKLVIFTTINQKIKFGLEIAVAGNYVLNKP